jgi:hypothetical protein
MSATNLLPAEPDNGETCGYDGRAIVDHRSIVRACEQSCPVREPEKPNNNEQRANHPNDDLHEKTLAAQINDGDIDRERVAIEKPAGQPGGLLLERTRARALCCSVIRPCAPRGLASIELSKLH